MIDLNPQPASRRHWPWLTLMGIVCGAVLVGVVALQLQQQKRLAAIFAERSEQRMVTMHRQEVEFLQMRDQWLRATDAGRELDLQALMLRYDI